MKSNHLILFKFQRRTLTKVVGMLSDKRDTVSSVVPDSPSSAAPANLPSPSEDELTRRWSWLVADNNESKPHVPTLADFIVAYPTIPGNLLGNCHVA